VIEFRLLGPLEAAVGGRSLSLPVGKPSALLARLLLDAGRVVSTEELIDALWGDRPPASAQKLLQVYVSQLRKVVGAATIETRRPGYVVPVETDAVDLARFERLTARAREAPSAAERARLLGRALAEWRGPALAEFRREPFARAAARRLAELRLAAIEQRLDADLELGRHAEVVPELEELVAGEPLRERLRRQLMLALYRSGREGDALAAYRAGRRLLVDELGIEPTPALQELERAILRRDPALEQAPGKRPARGSIVCVGPETALVFAPLCAGERELVAVELAREPGELKELSDRLEQVRHDLDGVGLALRTACFTSTAPGDDLVRLAGEQQAELLVAHSLAGDQLRVLLDGALCDVALWARPDLAFAATGPVLCAFGGGAEEWASLELAAWIARAHELPLQLIGAEAASGRRDASRTLAAASLALQRFAATPAEPVLVPPGPDGILAVPGSLVVVSLPHAELDATRRALVERSKVPVLLVHGGLRPGGLAPERTLTRFSWSLREAER